MEELRVEIWRPNQSSGRYKGDELGHHQQKWGEELVYCTLVAPCSVLDSAVLSKNYER